jgi:magnesium transporter
VSAPKELLERIHLRLEESFTGIGEVVKDLPPADVVDLLNQLTLVEAATVVAMLSVPRAVEVLDQPTMTRRPSIVPRLEPGRAAQLLDDLSADQRTEIVRQMGELERRRLLPKLKPEVRAEVERLLQYPERSAGGIMTTEYVRLDPALSVGEALKHIRAVAREKELIYACYVMEPGTGKLLGSLSLRDLVMAELDRPVTEYMRKRPVTVNALDSQESVAQKIAKYNLLAVPVLEADGSVAGFVTVDDVIDVMTEEQTKDILQMGGVEPGALDKPYFENSVPRVVRKRVSWLLLLFVAETFTGTVLRHYDDELTKVVALSFFIPLLIGTGGNAGSQTVTTIIRSLALGEIRLRDTLRVLAHEAATGLLLGLLIGLVAFGRARLWGQDNRLAFTVAVTVLTICTWSTTIGSLIPLAAERLKIDPTVLSAPLIATLVDATGLVIYFSIAKAVLGL